MKRLLVILGLILTPLFSVSQQQYTIDGESLNLKTEVSGSISLLWNIIDDHYRYFVKSGSTITELTNTKKDKKFQEEYKSVLQSVTSNKIDTSKVDLTLPSLKKFFNSYNKSVNSSYTYKDDTSKINTNLLLYGGITNHPLVDNPDNALNGIFGVELEFYNKIKLPKHALYFGINHALSSDKFDYSSTQFNFGYRFRFINNPKFNMYGNLNLATFTISKEIITYTNEEDNLVADEVSGSSLDAPFSFGIGADFKVNDFSYITLSYNELFALFYSNKGNFPMYLTIGYKINL